MGQKVSPIGFRTGVMEDWKSRWYASKREFAGLLVEDHKLRKHIKAKYAFAGIAKVEIERTRDESAVIEGKSAQLTNQSVPCAMVRTL